MKDLEREQAFDHQNDDRTRAFNVYKKQRRGDSVGWIIGALLLFFFNIVSIARLTIVGQFFDDVLFTLPFGWFKYVIYLVFFIVDISIYFGIKYKFKTRFLLMIGATIIVSCWLISAILLIVAWGSDSKLFVIDSYWSKNMVSDVMGSYFRNWKENSIFSDTATNSNPWLISPPESYFTMWAGGGIFGNLLAALAGFTTIFGGLIIAIFAFFITMVWIFTGDPLFLFKPKAKRRGRSLRILKLQGTAAVKPKSRGRYVNTLDFNPNNDFNDRMVLESIKESDVTIELPSFRRHRQEDLYQNHRQDFYNTQLDFSQTDEISPHHQLDDDKFLQKGARGYRQIQEQEPNYYDQSYQNFQNRLVPNRNLQSDLDKPKYKIPDENPPLRDNYYETRRQKDNLYEIPQSGIYGNISTNQARAIFEKETQVTPFGANGKTVEFFGNKNNDDKEPRLSPSQENRMEEVNFNKPRQSTLDEFISSEKIERQNYQEALAKQNQVRGPMAEIAAQRNNTRVIGSNFLNNSLMHPNKIEVDKNKKVKKEIYVNKGYKIPPISLLDEHNTSLEDLRRNEAMAHAKAEAINNALAQFNVSAKVVNMNIGPTVTKFELQPAPGTKVNSIISLENDLKLALASQNVRLEAPIQGKALVGIELANEVASLVRLRSVIEKTPIQKMNSKLMFAIGKNVTGELLFAELDKMPHLLVAGSTGSGKSVMINTIITSILLRSKPHEVKFLMIDPKKVELQIYSNLPHLLAPVINDMREANNALKKVINEMERRYSLFTEIGAKNIEGYNAKVTEEKSRLPFYVIVIDELADLMMTANKKDVEDSIMRLTQMARAAGIHLIVATQRPSTDVLTGVIKSNIPTRIAFAVSSGIDSRTILDSTGAEKLIGRGDLLYMPPGSSNLIRAQGAFLSDLEIERVVEFASNQQEQVFDEDFISNDDNQDTFAIGGSNDELYDEIKDFVIQIQKASTSLIQRRFSIGYNRAAKIIDDLEINGIIGPQNGSKPREVFIMNEDYYN
ncbi:DNA translocase [Spiroplasma sabaudiense Ar-1343]|uniref:DNA translocase n=1 Tax=Spiroplasma sabaudiense Ar-1343 TaxID=1276257 RepID=W6ABF2_9MOLU|nr:DNA translocase FtsK [Spiroplasma sabaudiense]AHI54180.1 DNA translocase [Spiroplasma sabaudiense Ar-1343]